MSNNIPLQDREIRLLFLLHNDCGAEDIGYNLMRTTIDDAPPYEALSYMWGEDRCQITLRKWRSYYDDDQSLPRSQISPKALRFSPPLD